MDFSYKKIKGISDCDNKNYPLAVWLNSMSVPVENWEYISKVCDAIDPSGSLIHEQVTGVSTSENSNDDFRNAGKNEVLKQEKFWFHWEDVNICDFEFCSICDNLSMPQYRGLYFVFNNEELLYIGKSLNIRKRWANHNHHREHQILSSHPEATMRFTPVSDVFSLSGLEKQAIRYFCPSLNGERVDAA